MEPNYQNNQSPDYYQQQGAYGQQPGQNDQYQQGYGQQPGYDQ